MNSHQCCFTGLSLLTLSIGTAAEPTVGGTAVLGPFTGGGAPLHLDNREPIAIEYYGTDLGFSYEHEGKIHFLFGDSWATEAYAPIEASTGSRHDDGFGTVDLEDWPDASRIGPQNLPLIRLGQNPGTSEMSAMDPGHAMDLGKTPMSGFSNGRREFAIFNVTKPRGCRTDADCGSELRCDTGLGYLGANYADEQNLTLPCADGQPGCNADTIADSDGRAIPGTGMCSDPTSTIWADTPAGRAAGIAYQQRIGIRSTSDPRKYTDVQTWLTNKFGNVTARALGDGKRLYLWGRPGFIGVGASQRSLGLYLAHTDMPSGPGFSWKLDFYTGTVDGVPQFRPNERDAQPLDLDSSTPGIQTAEVHDIVHQMSVVWIEHLRKWVMFYGGGITRLPSAALPDCGTLQLFTGLECRKVQVGNGAIRMRTAEEPWGPWTPPQDVIVGGDPALPGSGQYGPCGMLHHVACTGSSCAPHSRTPYYHDDEYGFFYSANIIEQWIVPRGPGVDVIWNASTWDPYRVVLLRTRINP